MRATHRRVGAPHNDEFCVDYIKRVVGIPGDEISYTNQRLAVNGQPVEVQAQGDYYDDDSMRYAPKFTEKLGDVDADLTLTATGSGYDLIRNGTASDTPSLRGLTPQAVEDHLKAFHAPHL